MVETQAYLDGYLKELKDFQNRVFENEQGLLKNILDYAFQNEGKKVRSSLVMLSAKLFGGVNKSTLIAATLIELLHNATLLHDDVVDNADTRRGQASVNNMFGDKASILAGDYLLSKTLSLSAENDEFYLLKLVSDTLVTISKGELIQIESKLKQSFTEESHFKIIKYKTASLIAACFKAGAHSVGASEENIEKVGRIGEYLGIAYQLKDDLIDFSSQQKIGKKQFQDIYDQKMTLPVIHALSKSQNGTREKTIEVFNKSEEITPDDVEIVLGIIRDELGVNYSEQKQLEYTSKAMEEIASLTLVDEEAKNQLILMVNTLLDREE